MNKSWPSHFGLARQSIALKQTTGVPQTGNGPVSPPSELELEYMAKGVSDEVKADPKVKVLNPVVEDGKLAEYYAKQAVDKVKNKVENTSQNILHNLYPRNW